MGPEAGRARQPAWFLAAALPAAAAHLLAAGEFGRRAATLGEAGTAALASTLVGSDGSRQSIAAVDAVAVHQLAVFDALVGPFRGGTVMDGSRTAMLLAAFLACLTLWPVLVQRLGIRRSAAAAGVLAAGVPTAVLGLHSAVDAGVLAALWLSVAAAVPWSRRGARVPGMVAVLLAVTTSALAAVPVLVLLAHLAFTGSLLERWPRVARLAAGVVAALAALAVAFLATGERVLAVAGDGAVPESVVYGVVAVGVALSAAAWWRLRWTRPVASAALVLCACALVPGPSAPTAVVLVVSGLAVLFAALVDDMATEASPVHAWRPRLVPAAALLGVALTVVPAVPAVARAVGSRPASGDELAQWINGHLDPGTVLAADDLARAQVIRDGVAGDRLVPLDTDPLPDDALVIVSARPSRGRQPAVDRSGSVPLATVDAGPGDARTVVRRPVTDVDATRTASELDRDDRARIGSMLATNPSLTLSPAARRHLSAGGVDSRLITVLAGFASTHRLEITEFVAEPAEPPDAPRRTVLITAVDGHPVARPEAADLARRWLGAQLPPYRPLLVRRTDDGLLVRYATPAPLGLLGR